MQTTDSGLIVALNEGRDRVSDPRSDYALVREINRELQQVDRYLHVVFVSDNAPTGIIPGLVAGRWHVRRSEPGTVDSYWPVVGPNNEYRDLGRHIIDQMKAADLWKDGALEKLNQRRIKRAEREAKAKALKAEQRQDHLAEDLKAAGRVFGDGGMLARKQFKK